MLPNEEQCLGRGVNMDIASLSTPRIQGLALALALPTLPDLQKDLMFQNEMFKRGMLFFPPERLSGTTVAKILVVVRSPCSVS